MTSVTGIKCNSCFCRRSKVKCHIERRGRGGVSGDIKKGLRSEGPPAGRSPRGRARTTSGRRGDLCSQVFFTWRHKCWLWVQSTYKNYWILTLHVSNVEAGVVPCCCCCCFSFFKKQNKTKTLLFYTVFHRYLEIWTRQAYSVTHLLLFL